MSFPKGILKSFCYSSQEVDKFKNAESIVSIMEEEKEGVTYYSIYNEKKSRGFEYRVDTENCLKLYKTKTNHAFNAIRVLGELKDLYDPALINQVREDFPDSLISDIDIDLNLTGSVRWIDE